MAALSNATYGAAHQAERERLLAELDAAREVATADRAIAAAAEERLARALAAYNQALAAAGTTTG